MGALMNYVGLLKGSIVTLIGIAFFFAIIGVFGMAVSIAALGAFITLAVGIFVNSQRLTDSE